MAKPGFGEPPRRLLATASRWSLAFACAALLPLAAPVVPTAAQEAELAPGGAATVANTDGDGVVLREGPGYDARVLDGFPEGTAVALTDGPIYADDGSVWYGVVVGGRDGYVVSDYLAPGGPPAPTSGGEVAPLTAAGQGAATIETNDPGVMAAEPGTNAPAPAPTANPGSTATTPAATAAEGTAEQAQAVPGAAAEANALVNLRSGPGEGYETLRVLPPGAPVTVTGPSEGGWTPVWYNGSEGYIADAYLDAADGDGVAQLAQELPADTDTDTDTGSEPGPPAGAADGGRSGVATVTEAAELKAEPLMTSATLATLPVGAVYQPTAGPVQGFYRVAHEGQEGWVSGAFLAFDAATVTPAGAAPADTAPAPTPAGATPLAGDATAEEPASTGLIWPVSGGTWYVMQGYNGSSHVNRDSNWQYAYALDIARRDGETAGTTVFSPANGTVRWTDPGSGGLSIDLGDGFAVAMFHITLAGDVRDGQPIAQGDPIGTVSGPGGMGFAGSPHLHIALWETADGGNWDRHAAPFVGAHALEGTEFPDIGGGQQHRGVEFVP